MHAHSRQARRRLIPFRRRRVELVRPDEGDCIAKRGSWSENSGHTESLDLIYIILGNRPAGDDEYIVQSPLLKCLHNPGRR